MTATLTKDAEGQVASAGNQQEVLDRLGSTRAAELLREAAQRYADLLYQEMRATYTEAVAGLQASYHSLSDALAARDAVAGNPLTLEVEQQLRDLAQRLAGGRLDQYAERLRAFLETQPDADELAEWLAERALSAAGIWARGDSLDMRRRARRDFYARNRPPDGRWTIRPEGAKEPACEHVAGRIYDSYAEAEDALDSAWHPNCVHYVEPIDLPSSPEPQRQSPRFTQPPAAPTQVQLQAARAAEDGLWMSPREVLVAFDGAGNEVLRVVGGHSWVDIRPEDAGELAGTVVTHNHPSGLAYPAGSPLRAGHSFSPDDVLNAAADNLTELRAVTPIYRYSLRPGPKGWPSQAEIRATYTRYAALVLQRSLEAMRQGRISREQAVANHWHAVWLLAAHALDLIYRRERR